MDDDSPESDPNALEQDQAAEARTVFERFLARLFADRFLTTSPASDPSPPQPANIAPPVPFFSASSIVHPSPQESDRAAAAFAEHPADRPIPPAAHMGSQPDDVVFCVEDTVGLKDDRFSVGVVDRSFGDVDSHAPRPQRDYGEDIEKHHDIALGDFEKFMRTGIPPRGAVLVSWQTQLKTELIPESKLELLDRALYVGDVVKRNAKDPMSGTVIGTKAVCTLFPATMFNGGHLTHAMTDDLSIRGVPADELINVHEYVEGALVVYEDWIGRIEEVYEEVAIKLSNNSVVVVENPDDLEHDDAMTDRLSVGDTVKTKKGNLRRGRWRYGAFDPNVRPHGMVVETRPLFISVHWLSRRIGGSTSASQHQEPPSRLYRDEMDSHNLFVYDASRSAAATLPVSTDGAVRSYHVAEVTVGDRVHFKDLTGAAVKYDGTRNMPNGYPQGKLTKVPRTETLGYDMNVFLVMQTHTQVTVQWQDLTITEDMSPSLIPDPNVEDDDEVWPGEIVCTKGQRESTGGDVPWTFRPAKVGIVQAVKSRDRIATVRWFENPSIQFLEEDLIPPSETGKLCDSTEDVSLYDIRSTPSLTRRRGDFVLVHPEAIDFQALPANIEGPSWFGEVIDLGLDGKITVRLGAAKPVVDIRVPSERVTLAYSSDMDSQFFSMPALDGGSVDYDDEEDVSDFDSASFNEMWIEYEGMDEPIGGSNEEDWSTEEEDEESDDDESMPDLEPTEDAVTSNTTPEASDADRKSPVQMDAEPSAPDPHTLSSTAEDAVMTTHDSSEPNANGMTSDGPSPFMILDSLPPSDHHYLRHTASSSSVFMRRVAKEHKILRGSLPANIFVRTWESRLDLIRVLIIGPSDTPYEFAPFVIDFHLGSSYPQQPPEAFFHSWTNGNGPVNPNLYEDGKICLSLLGTWHADERNESWSPSKSTLLQVLVSIMGLVLVKEPYYNEAGYDVHREAPETKLSSALYTERAYFRARAFIAHALSNNVSPFEEDLEYLYRSTSDTSPKLLDKAIEAAKDVLKRSSNGSEEGERDGLRKISLGATVMLRRQLEKLEGLRLQAPQNPA
ncbi:hypothetical protein BU26DRAFT_518343 [Trematosphaeria pertusa]|uniref:UBC core domain-containing protein n=1 Tax=Trematosphaeria pertusa TaxID=390896 RepID=A0A6A6IHY0_9PLEO|nr:uncharacterized protein BU26DRAFT_518343 [Trematosphaeria pertusa]KAF2249809.1 hypothetical protein BU26DRAFT_518343 [Trematosphaeria pertusa]